MFRKVEDNRTCRDIIASSAYAFFALAIIFIIGGFLQEKSRIIDAGAVAFLALILISFKSRLAAFLLLLIALFLMVTTMLTVFGVMDLGGRNVILAAIAVYAGVRGVESTFKYHSRYKD